MPGLLPLLLARRHRGLFQNPWRRTSPHVPRHLVVVLRRRTGPRGRGRGPGRGIPRVGGAGRWLPSSMARSCAVQYLGALGHAGSRTGCQGWPQHRGERTGGAASASGGRGASRTALPAGRSAAGALLRDRWPLAGGSCPLSWWPCLREVRAGAHAPRLWRPLSGNRPAAEPGSMPQSAGFAEAGGDVGAAAEAVWRWHR
mmetsp:Transcript_122573/g.357946  ORF Transcript_122573/g.357946 Transcript_122573/m.357946 type:complete len:200 (-) Transcript_122573:163-762(-)